VGAALVKAAAEGCRAAGCEWMHVDFEEHLRSFTLGCDRDTRQRGNGMILKP
jgi:multimeric flavodoxin WrbA